MNAKEARKAIEYDVLNDGAWDAKGYLAALEGPEVSALVKALEAIKNREQYSCDCVGGDDGECSCDFSFMQFVAEQALAEFKGEKK